jgi:predicted metal-dependent phosphoesterase TrpH
MMQEARYRGLNAVAFAEHTSRDQLAPIKAYQEALTFNNGVKVYPAAEITIENPIDKLGKKLHCVILANINRLEEILRQKPKHLQDIPREETMRILAHPIKKNLLKSLGLVQLFDAIEYSKAMPSLRKKDEYYCDEQENVLVIASSDAHYPTQFGLHTKIKTLHETGIETLNKDNIVSLEIPSESKNWIENFDPLRI